MTDAVAIASHSSTIEERIERALMTAAELVDAYGDDYVPFFERLEAELQALRVRASAADRARQLAARVRARPALSRNSGLATG